MDNKTVYAVIIGVVLFVSGLALRMFAKQEGIQIILFFVTFLIVGIVATGVKRGFLLGFLLSLILQLVGSAILSPQDFAAMSDPDVAAAILMLDLINSAILGALGAAGGFLGGKISRKSKANETNPPKSEDVSK